MAEKRAAHFRCDGCTKIFPIREREIVVVDYTCFNYDGYREFNSNRYHCQLCRKCSKGNEF